SFFGVLRIDEEKARDGSIYRKLYHGTTLHGVQQVFPEQPKPVAISYYHKTGPIGEIFEEFPKQREGAHLAFIGLGTGTLTAYAEKGQHVTVFEIDPLVLRIATGKVRRHGTGEYEEMFTFYNRCEAAKRIVLGDARLKLEEQEEIYDMI